MMAIKKENHYTNKFTSSAEPERVYQALTQEIDKWWSESANKALLVGDEFTANFEKSTRWVMRITKAVPSQSLTWNVIEANHELENLSSKDEWKGTTIKWEISKNNTGSMIAFTHEGLVPALECFEICGSGWDYFLRSLQELLKTGKGFPYKE